jgi:type VI secretion system protein ImpE
LNAPTHFVLDKSLAEKVAEAQNKVREAATDASFRVYLCQLFCVTGIWEKAVSQLQAAAQFDAKSIPMAQLYREAIRCELFREEVFSGVRRPNFLGELSEWIGLLSEAIGLAGRGKFEQGAALREKALELAPTTSGMLDNTQFEWIADADSRLGPVCEAFVNGQYYWIPFDHISTLQLEAPSDLRDLVWTPGVITLRNGGRHPALVPTRYPNSQNEADEYALAKKTSWVERPSDTWIGLGQRMFATDVGEFAQLDTREIAFDAA